MPTLNDHLARLESIDLIRLAQLEPEIEYLFRHALTQEAAYESLLKQDRKALHLDVARAIEAAYPERVEEFAAVLALHYAAAEDEARALHFFTLAGDAAAHKYANAEAIQHYSAALELAKKLPGGEKLKSLYTAIGHAHELSGDYPAALRTYQDMDRVAHQRRDRGLELTALTCQATIRATTTSVHDPAEAQRLLDAALALADETGDRAAESTIHWNLMLFHKFAGHGQKAVEHGEASLKLAQELGLREQQAFTLNDLITHGYLDAGNILKARELVDRVPPLWRELNNLPMLADSHSSAAIVHYLLGEYDQVIAKSDEARRICESIHNLWGLSYSRWIVGQVYAERGQVATAIATMTECATLGEQAGFVGALVGVGSDLAYLYGWLGMPEAGLKWADQALASSRAGLPGWASWPLAVSACLYVAMGDLDRGQARLVELEQASDAHLLLEFPLSLMYVNVARARVALAQGDLPAAYHALDDLTGYLDRCAIRAFYPDALIMRARALQAEKRTEEAAAILGQARTRAAELGSRRTLWQIEAALWQIGGKQARRTAARKHIQFIADHCGDAAIRAAFLAQAEVRAVMEG